MFKQLNTLIGSAGAILALGPTATLLSGTIDVPPDFYDFLLFGTGFVGIMTFLAILILRRWILRVRPLILGGLILVAGVGGLFFAWKAYDHSNRYVFPVGIRQADGSIEQRHFVRPAEPTGELGRLFNEKYGRSWEHLVTGEEWLRVEGWMYDQSRPNQRLLILYVFAAQLLLLIAFLVAGWKSVTVVDRTDEAE